MASAWKKTLDKLYELCWFPKMSRIVRKFIDNYLFSKVSKNKIGETQIQALHTIPKTFYP